MLENREDTIFNLGMYDPCILFILYPNGWIACDLEGYIIINGEKWEQKRRNIGIHSQLEVFWRLYNKQDHPDKYFLNGRMWLSKNIQLFLVEMINENERSLLKIFALILIFL